VAQLQFLAQHAAGLTSYGAAPDALKGWHFWRIALSRGLVPVLGWSSFIFLPVAVLGLTLYAWNAAPGLLPLLPVGLALLVALQRERLEENAALSAMLETLLD
jgi:hypothetical protein